MRRILSARSRANVCPSRCTRRGRRSAPAARARSVARAQRPDALVERAVHHDAALPRCGCAYVRGERSRQNVGLSSTALRSAIAGPRRRAVAARSSGGSCSTNRLLTDEWTTVRLDDVRLGDQRVHRERRHASSGRACRSCRGRPRRGPEALTARSRRGHTRAELELERVDVVGAGVPAIVRVQHDVPGRAR